MTASAFVFASDLVDEGRAVVLERLAAAGLDGVSMAATYHHARDVFPHNPNRKVVYLEGGVAYFPSKVTGRIKPVVASIARDADPLADLVGAVGGHGLRASAWVVVLHNSRLAMANPDCTPHNAFGDRLLNSLCPAHPDVRAYAVALAADVARYGLEAIKLEAVQYMAYDHGNHHERSFVPLSPNVRFLLGLCFCVHCLAAARLANVDGERVRAVARARLEALFALASAETHEAEVEDPWLQSLAAGELGRFGAVRQEVVSSLVAEMTAAVHRVAAATRVVYLDPSGATLGYASGRPASERSAPSIGWRDGIDLPAIARVVDGLGMLAYFATPERFEREVAAYQAIPAVPRLEVIVRPMPPDTASPGDLAAKVASARRAGAADVSFYHYGFMRLENLAWIREALISTAAGGDS